MMQLTIQNRTAAHRITPTYDAFNYSVTYKDAPIQRTKRLVFIL